MRLSDLPENVRRRGEETASGAPDAAARLEPNTTGVPRYPTVSVQLLGGDGNAFAVLGVVRRALRRAGVADDEVSRFFDEATGGDYDHLLATVMRWVEVD